MAAWCSAEAGRWPPDDVTPALSDAGARPTRLVVTRTLEAHFIRLTPWTYADPPGVALRRGAGGPRERPRRAIATECSRPPFKVLSITAGFSLAPAVGARSVILKEPQRARQLGLSAPRRS
jgi:hypothetical protein